MTWIFKKHAIFSSLLISISLISTSIVAQVAPIKDEANQSNCMSHYNFNEMPAHKLTDKITMQFVTSSQFTVIQWNLKKGARLLPQHSHLNEQVIRVIKGALEVHTGDKTYTIYPGEVMIFPPYVSHGFIALEDAVMYEQQTPIREDFLKPGFIERLSKHLKSNQ